MKRGLAAALVAFAAMFAMSGCAGSPQDEAQKVEEVTVDYRGGTLYCLSSFYDRSQTLTCDFERFYAEHPTFPKVAS